MKKLICVIPARKGSKRIKNKNLKNFHGKPIITHVIKKLKKFRIFEKIYVSTDSNIIERTVKKNKVDVIRRNKKLSNDYTGTQEVLKDAIEKIEKKNLDFDYVCCIYPTSVFVEVSYLKLALKKIKKDNLNFVFSAKKYEHPVFRSFYKSSSKLILPTFKQNKNGKRRTQDFKEVFYDAAQFYLGNKNSWKTKKNIIYGNVDFIEIPKFGSTDIDDKKDWDNAKILWKILNK